MKFDSVLPRSVFGMMEWPSVRAMFAKLDLKISTSRYLPSYNIVQKLKLEILKMN